MRIWWCQEHEAPGWVTTGEDTETRICLVGVDRHLPEAGCRMVPMRLIPDNPDWPALEMAMRGHLYEDEAADSVLVVKDWLAVLDGETP